jgi:hypothetical protein
VVSPLPPSNAYLDHVSPKGSTTHECGRVWYERAVKSQRIYSGTRLIVLEEAGLYLRILCFPAQIRIENLRNTNPEHRCYTGLFTENEPRYGVEVTARIVVSCMLMFTYVH